MHFFEHKIVKIRDELDNIITEGSSTINNLSTPLVETVFTKLNSLSEKQISKLISESKSIACELDVIPTPKLKDNLQCLAPVIMEIVNQSLESGVFPQESKVLLLDHY